MNHISGQRPSIPEGRGAFLRRLLAENLLAEGLYGLAFLPGAQFLETLDKAAVSAETMIKYDAAKAKSLVVVALQYGDGGYPLPPWAKPRSEKGGQTDACGSPFSGASPIMLRIARFARANWYRELSRRMHSAVSRTIAEAAEEGITLPPAKAWHRLVNSGLPEKPLAERAGLGWIGKNGIVIAVAAPERRKGEAVAKVPAYSSAIVLGLLLCPVDLEPPMPDPTRNLCGACRRCLEACPTGALGIGAAGDGRVSAYERKRCIQHWTAIEGEIPEALLATWDNRLYGCDACLEACPHFVPDFDAYCDIGRLGPALPAQYFLENDDDSVRRDLSGSALGLAWMSVRAFRRNARSAIYEARKLAR